MPGLGALAKDKPPILGLIQRGGQVVLCMLAHVQQATIKPIIAATIAPGTLVHTDEYGIYARLQAWGYWHTTVCHGRGEYACDEDGDEFCEPPGGPGRAVKDPVEIPAHVAFSFQSSRGSFSALRPPASHSQIAVSRRNAFAQDQAEASGRPERGEQMCCLEAGLP